MKKTIVIILSLIPLAGCLTVKPIERELNYKLSLSQDVPELKVHVDVEESYINGQQSSSLLKERLDSIFVSALNKVGKHKETGDTLKLEVGYVLTTDGKKRRPIVWTTVEKFDLNSKQAILVVGNYFDRLYKFHFTIKVRATVLSGSRIKWSKDYIVNDTETINMAADGFVDGVAVSVKRGWMLDDLYKKSLQNLTHRILKDIAKGETVKLSSL